MNAYWGRWDKALHTLNLHSALFTKRKTPVLTGWVAEWAPELMLLPWNGELIPLDKLLGGEAPHILNLGSGWR